MTVMEEVLMKGLSDAGSTPARSTERMTYYKYVVISNVYRIKRVLHEKCRTLFCNTALL